MPMLDGDYQSELGQNGVGDMVKLGNGQTEWWR